MLYPHSKCHAKQIAVRQTSLRSVKSLNSKQFGIYRQAELFSSAAAVAVVLGGGLPM